MVTGDFITRHIEVMPSGAKNYLTWFVGWDRLYGTYAEWARENSVERLSAKGFFKELEKLGAAGHFQRGERQVINLRLK